jgi:formate hydrogenlyase transcriptional activator
MCPTTKDGPSEHRRTFGHPLQRRYFSIDDAWLPSQPTLRLDGAGALPDAPQDQEKEMIEAALAKSKGRVAGPRGAAATLGIPPSTLESNIKQLMIEKSRFTSAS